MTRPPFPKSFPEFARMFSTEDACFDYIVASRWPEGFVCRYCRHDNSFDRRDIRAVQCTRCSGTNYITAGTVMHGSRQPLSFWLWAAYLIVTDKRGMSAKRLQEHLGIKRYETAFQMFHKLRAAMVNPERVKLKGVVEVDETYIGGPKPGKRGRGAEGKAIVVGAVEVKDDKPSRVRFKVVSSASRSEIFKFIKATVEEGSMVITDAAITYESLSREGYKHDTQSTVWDDEPEDVLKYFHLAVSNLKTWLLGTHHGAVSKKHLQAYLNEFAFRYNRRRNLQAAFRTLLGLTSVVEWPTYEGLYTGSFEHRNPV